MTTTNETVENCERCARLEQKVGDLRSALQLVVATGNLALRYSEELAPPSDDGQEMGGEDVIAEAITDS